MLIDYYKITMDTKKNIVKDNDENSTCGEIIHYDVLNEIFKNLSLKDLHRAEEVCKLWQQVAKKEILRRNDIHSFILPLQILDNNYDGSNSKWHISDSLMSLPCVLCVFKGEDEPISAEKVYQQYSRVLKCNKYTTVCDSLAVFINCEEVSRINNFGVGITIPNTPRLKITYYCLEDYDIISHGNANTLSHLADQVLKSLLFNEEEHNCFIILSEQCKHFEDALYTRTYISELLKTLEKRCKPGTYSLWGGEFSTIITDLDEHDIYCQTWSIGLKLSGPAIKSWFIVLKLHLTNDETENKLLNFKKQIVTNSKSIAFAMIPSNKMESNVQRLVKTEVFRKIFPKIPLLGIYKQENEGLTQFGANSTNYDSEPGLEHRNSVNFLILTTT